MATGRRTTTRSPSRKKRRRKTKRPKLPALWPLLMVAALLVGAGAIYLLLCRPSPPKPAPVKEVPRRDVVRALVEAALFEENIPRQRITLLPDGLKVSLPEGMAAGELIPSLEEKLVRADRRLRVQRRKGKEGVWAEVWGPEGRIVTVLFYHPRVQPAQVSIVVDDLGGNLEEAEAFMELGKPLTLSLLPLQLHTREIAQLAHRRGFEVMVHLPMEPRGYPLRDPGKGALLVSMGAQELRRALDRLLSDVPYAVGVNNHMGSRFMEHPEGVRVVLEALKGKGLFFLDSLTTPRSQGFALARRMGVKAAKRDVFLDNEPKEEVFMRQWRLLLLRAKERGMAVGICHPHPTTLSALLKGLEELGGTELVPLSWIIRRMPD